MASVFLARERALKRLVAIKVLAPELAAGGDSRARFQREAETAAGVQHPNIVPIYRVGEADGLAYFTMAYVEGDNIAARLQAEGRFAPGEAMRVARDVASALGAAHRQGIIHRDIKPQNVLIERDTGRVLVTDFGIAQITTPVPGLETESLTVAGMVMGTPRYMSPEQASGERELSPASDFYALGIVLYELLCGEYPYDVGAQRNFLVAHLTQQPIPLVVRVGDVPAGIERMVLRLLAKDPSQRFQSAAELAAALDTGEVSQVAPAARPIRRGWRRAVVPAILGVGVLVAALRFFGSSDRPPDGVNPRQSILLGFFTNTRATADLDWLRLGGVELLGQSLSRWEDLQVVGVDRLLDLARRVGVGDGAPLSRAQAVRLAREAGVWTTTTGSIIPIGHDSIRISVRVYDVASGEELSNVATDAVPDANLQGAFDRLADQILEVSGAPKGALLEVEPPTRSIEAFRAYIEGIEARNDWRIDSAAAAFRRAIDHDPTFALAYIELSQMLSVLESALPDPTYVGLADSAVHYARDGSPKQRLMAQAYRAYVNADFARARDLYRQLVARDSTSIQGWSGLGGANFLDWTYTGTGADRRFPFDPTTALRSYRRALELDRQDYRSYPVLTLLYASAASDEADRRIPAYGDPPPGAIHTLGNRVPVAWYTLVMVSDDSIVAVRTDSLADRFPPAELESARARARQYGEAILRDWVALAPDQGVAWLYLATIQHQDRKYREGLASLARAEAAGLPSVTPYPIIRLDRLLEAHFFDEVVALADSLAALPEYQTLEGRTALLAAGPLANSDYARGRIASALRRRGAFLAAARELQLSDVLIREMGLLPSSSRLRALAAADIATPDLVHLVADSIDLLAASMPDSAGRTFRSNRSWAVLLAAAGLGDTATVARLRRDPALEGNTGVDAWAAVRAGVLEEARQRYAAALADTSSAPMHVAALARTAEALGLHEAALAHYRILDTLRYVGGAVDPDFITLARSYAFRAAVFQALDQTDSAKVYYQRFLGLWEDPDPALQPERNLARKALGDLERADRGDRSP